MKLSFQDDRPEEQNTFMFETTRKVMVEEAIAERLIADDDLAGVTEVMPLFFGLASEVRCDLYRYHDRIHQKLQPPIIQNCFCYCFGKGAESAYLWNESVDGKIEFSYLPDDAIAGRVGARVSEDFSMVITAAMIPTQNVFCGFQDEFLIKPQYHTQQGGRWLADWIACGLYWSSAIGLDFGMNELGFR
jgi:hypothetical protein